MKTGAIKHFTTVFFLFDVLCHVALGDATAAALDDDFLGVNKTESFTSV